MQQKRRWMVLVGTVFGAATLLAACGDDDGASASRDEVGETSDEGDADDLGLAVGPDDVTIENGDQSVTIGADFPDGFPEGAVSLPEDFSLLQIQEREAAGNPQWIFVGGVPNAPEGVASELVGLYGDPDEKADANGSITMTWQGHEGHDIRFTLQTNADGETAATVSVVEL